MTWPVRSHHASRRNALGALAELRRVRREHQEVEDFLSLLLAEERDEVTSG